MYFLHTKDLSFAVRSTKCICTCGEVFSVPPVPEYAAEDGWVSESTLWENPSLLRCPKCGAVYGRFWMAGSDIRKCSLSSVEDVLGDDSRLIIKKEIVSLGLEDGDVRITEVQTYETTIARAPTFGVERILKDGGEVKLTTSRISTSLSNVPFVPVFKCGPVGKEIEFVCNSVLTESIPKAVLTIMRYPVLDTIYQTYMINQDYDNSRDLKTWIRRAMNQLVPGEKSMKMAFGLPKALSNSVCGRISLSKATWAFKEFGPGLAENVIEASIKVVGNQDSYKENFREFASFYAGLTTAERERVMTYLTHDVDVYQGIDSPLAAWEILKDYRRMCAEMEIPAILCPKSLKLQHDIAARNYKLCLDEIKIRNFQRAVAAENYQQLVWTSKDKQWTVLVPEKPDDMVEEGRRQSHCVASYIGDVTNGDYRVCFLRKANDPDHPVLTLTVNKGNCCCYYKGFDNREATEEERKVLREWTAAKELTLDAVG